jgi:hypothetical protein
VAKFSRCVGRGTASEAAEKLDVAMVLKGRTFRCAVQALYFCHSEWASAHEESALATFSAASLAAEVRMFRQHCNFGVMT